MNAPTPQRAPDDHAGDPVGASAGRSIPPGPSTLVDRGLALLLHLVSHRDTDGDTEREMLQEHRHGRLVATDRLFARLPPIPLEGRRVLDVGCGMGSTCVRLANDGAKQVDGVDIDAERIAMAQEFLEQEEPELVGRVRFRTISSLADLGQERFDLVVSQDSFEHLEDPEQAAVELRDLLAPDGMLAIAFGPLWNSPFGGHLDHVTALPWAHLLFPERIVMHERMRFRPDQRAHRYEDFRGGLNRMTRARFEAIMRSTGLVPLHYATNVGDNPVVRVMRAIVDTPLGRRRRVRELLTANVYSIWTRAGSSATL